MKTTGIALGVVIALVVACGGEAPQSGEPESVPAVEEAVLASGSVYTVIDVADGGSIQGTVTFRGAVPTPSSVSIEEDVEVCGEARDVQWLQVGPGQGLANVVVSLTDIRSGISIEGTVGTLVLDQKGCEFSPHVLIAPVGATVNVLNNDPITHSLHTAAFANRPVDRAQPAELHSIDLTFAVAEKVKVRCDMHEWMSAWVVVIEHPYHAVTSASGGFVLDNVPPGTYTMEVWHEDLGAVTQKVTVTAGGTADVSVEMKEPGEAP